MRIKRIQTVGAHISAHPNDYNQAEICGTRCCFAGHAVLLFGTKKQKAGFKARSNGEMNGFEVEVVAEKLLGLKREQADELFFGGPDWFDDAWGMRGTANHRAKLATKRLQHFIATKGKE